MKKYEIIEDIPSVREPAGIYTYLHSHTADYKLFRLLEELVTLNEKIVSTWLNITSRTFRNYKKSEVKFKENTKEHIVSLLSLYKHGMEVFGSKEDFEAWLVQDNVLLDGKSPSSFLDTISGIRFIYGRLTAMEYGENV